MIYKNIRSCLKNSNCFLISFIAHCIFILCCLFRPSQENEIITEPNHFLQAYVYRTSYYTHSESFLGVAIIADTSSKKRSQDAPQDDSRKNDKIIKNNPLLKILHQAIAAKQSYPEEAVSLNQTGTVKIKFLLFPNGQISHVSIIKSSGFANIDSAALTAVQAISPVHSTNLYLKKAEFFTIDIVFSS